MPDYKKMSIAELEDARHRLMNERLKISAEQGLVASILNDKGAKAAAEQKFASMGEAEKKEMAQLIMGAGGIKSKEEMGKL